MSAWVEVHVKGNRRAYVQATALVGVVMPKGADGEFVATDTEPLILVIQGGEQLDGVFGMSANELLRRCAGAKAILRLTEMEYVLCRTSEDALEAFYATLAEVKGVGRGRAA